MIVVIKNLIIQSQLFRHYCINKLLVAILKSNSNKDPKHFLNLTNPAAGKCSEFTDAVLEK